MPLKEYLAKIGYSYIAERPSDDPHPVLVIKMGVNGELELTLIGISAEGHKSGLQEGDILFKVLGEVVNMQSARKLLGQISSMKVGDVTDVVVKRGEKEVLAKIPLQQRKDEHIFEEMKQIREQQNFLRDVWKRNL